MIAAAALLIFDDAGLMPIRGPPLISRSFAATPLFAAVGLLMCFRQLLEGPIGQLLRRCFSAMRRHLGCQLSRFIVCRRLAFAGFIFFQEYLGRGCRARCRRRFDADCSRCRRLIDAGFFRRGPKGLDDFAAEGLVRQPMWASPHYFHADFSSGAAEADGFLM